MHTALSPYVAADLVAQRRAEAVQAGLAARLVAARRVQRRAERADLRARQIRRTIR